MRQSPVWFICLAVLCSWFATGAVSTADHASAECTLRVGWEDWSPYIYAKDNSISGPEHELLMQLAAAAGCTLSFVEMPWARALVSLQEGQVELLYGASRTADREAYATFSVPYRYEQMKLLSWQDNRQDSSQALSLAAWLDTQDASGKRPVIGVIRGFHYGDAAQAILKEYTSVLTVDVGSDNQLLDMLLAGRIDGYLVEEIVGEEQLSDVSAALTMTAIRELTPEPMHLMFSRSVPEHVIKRFNAAILKRQGFGKLDS